MRSICPCIVLHLPHRSSSVLAVPLEHALLSNVIVRTDSGLDLVPSNFGLAGLAFMADLAREMRLRAALSHFVNTPDCVYSYIFIDCPPRLDVRFASVNALVAADVVLIPIVPEPLPELTQGDVFRAIRHVRLLRASSSALHMCGCARQVIGVNLGRPSAI